MRDDFARMHNEYLDSDRYFASEEPIALHEDGTLKGYGRRQHGLNGKDGDLDETGQNQVETAWWFADGHIEIKGTRYADVCPPLCCQNNRNDECWDVAQEMVADLPYEGEWSDDYWYLGEKYNLEVQCNWNDDETDEQNIARATEAAFDVINTNSAEFEQAISTLHKQLDELGKEHEQRINAERLARKASKAAKRK